MKSDLLIFSQSFISPTTWPSISQPTLDNPVLLLPVKIFALLLFPATEVSHSSGKMSKNKKRRDRARASSLTPQKTNTAMANAVIPPGTDPWAAANKKIKFPDTDAPNAASLAIPKPLTPGALGTGKKTNQQGSASQSSTKIEVPKDPTKQPSLLKQRFIDAKTKTDTPRSFLGPMGQYQEG